MMFDKNMRKALVVFFATLFLVTNNAKAEGIYSKADAARLFSMSLDDWNMNVVSIHASGAGVGRGQPENGYGLAMQTAVGQILVSPHYSRPDKPEFLQVTIAYPPAIARTLTLEALRETGEIAVNQMLPEFTMTHEVENFEGGFLTISFIREN